MTDIPHISAIQRTNGDGMENPDSVDSDVLANRAALLSIGEKYICRPELFGTGTLNPGILPRQMIHLKPQTVQVPPNKDIFSKNVKGKEPKFVPYEPYKAAVNAIVPPAKIEKNSRKRTKDSNVSVNLKFLPALEISCDPKQNNSCQLELEKYTLTTEVETLRTQNQDLEKQLKFQAQVNTELKNMLVAAVGEDLESRVQHLTEDKLQLARALLNSAQKLSSHQEQLEWLVGQCEVWRSKFLASSLMLEEVSRSTAILRGRTRELQDVMKDLLRERIPLHDNMFHTLKNLQILRENFDPASGLTLATSPHRQQTPCSSSVNEVAESCQLLSECLAHRLLGTSLVTNGYRASPFNEITTPAEKKAQELLQKSSELLGTLPDIACSAVVGAAAVAGGLFPHIGSTPTSCCAHCSGDMKTL